MARSLAWRHDFSEEWYRGGFLRGGAAEGVERWGGGPGVEPHQPHPRPAALVRPDARACLRRVRRGLARRARAAHGGGRRAGGAAVARHGGAHAGGGALVHRLLAAPAAGPRHLPRVRTPPHPPGAVHRRAAGRRRAAHTARTAHRRTAGASAALRAVRRLLPVPGWRGTAGRPRVSAHGRRACRKAGAKRGPRRDGATRLIESRIVLELQSARGIRSAYGSIGT